MRVGQMPRWATFSQRFSELRTEISARFHLSGLTRELATAGLTVANSWTDPNPASPWFSPPPVDQKAPTAQRKSAVCLDNAQAESFWATLKVEFMSGIYASAPVVDAFDPA